MSMAMPTTGYSGSPGCFHAEVVQASGRLGASGLSETERHFAVAMHLSPLGVFLIGPLAFIAPLVLWLVRRQRSAFNDDHGREAVNFIISFVALHLILAITVIGLVGIPVLWVIGAVSLIRAAIASGRAEYFRYPMTIRFLP